MDKTKSVAAPSSTMDPSSGDATARGRSVLSYLPAICTVGLFVSGIGVLWHFFASKETQDYWQQPKTYTSVVEGHEALAIEKIFKDVFPIRDFSTGLLNAVSFQVFGEARKGLVRGDEGWLFSDEEFSWNRKSAAMVESHMTFVADAVARLKAAGIEPIILLVPEKADVYRDKLGPVEAPASRKTYYRDIRSRLEGLGVKVPDLREAFAEARKAGDVFLKTDTHWTVAGAGAGARQIADILGADDDLSRGKFTLSEEAEQEHSGDLMKFARLSVFSPYIPMAVDRIVALSAKKADASLDDLLADDAAAPQVAIVGSSYSANAKWSFEAQIKAAAGAEVINFAEEGKGPFKPMATFLSDRLPKQQGLKYVVWEMPLRYFDEASY